MFKEWFAQYSWNGLALINFAAFCYMTYMWWKKKEESNTLLTIAGGVLLINALLWVLGLRY